MQHFKSVYPIITINLFLLIACIFSGCKKNGFAPPNYTFSKDGLAYIQLAVGKYFIYKDSATLKTDSVVVTESLLETVSETGQAPGGFGYPYTVQRYSLILSKIDSSGTTVWLTGNASSELSLGDNVFLLPSDIYTSGYLFRYPPDSPISSMTVEGKIYTDVILMANAKSSYYWAKGVGLIQKSSVDNAGVRKTYTLLRNN
jgi:hypothetical protein